MANAASASLEKFGRISDTGKAGGELFLSVAVSLVGLLGQHVLHAAVGGSLAKFVEGAGSGDGVGSVAKCGFVFGVDGDGGIAVGVCRVNFGRLVTDAGECFEGVAGECRQVTVYSFG